MRNLITIIFYASSVITTFASLGLNSNFTRAIPGELIDDRFVFGPIAGLSENESGAVD
ncbi:MAG: hypothetical protein P0116_13045 [Candidatus Nitrosocosmicus sp.]|nr:hypothetical protein [Candidatus Nitrosocosmicus sp.]